MADQGKEQTIGNIDASTPVGAILTMDGGERYRLEGHGDDDTFGLVGVGEASELAGFYTYEDWLDDYAPFVAEVKYPEATAVPADCARTDLPAAQGHIDEADPDDMPDRPNPHEDPEVFGNGPYGIPVSTMEAIEEARDQHKESRAAYESLNDQAKAAKKEMDADQEALNRAIDAMLDGELVREDGWPKDAPLAAVADERPVAARNEAWEAVELADLTDPHIKVGVLKVLAENGIHTMGQLSEWQAEKGDFWSKDLKGIGKAACDSISDATDAYWVRNPRKVDDVPFAPAMESSSAACDGSCGWKELSDEIQDLLDDDRYEFANDTLTGIMDWITENEHCTDAQKQAVKNVRESAENR